MFGHQLFSTASRNALLRSASLTCPSFVSRFYASRAVKSKISASSSAEGASAQSSLPNHTLKADEEVKAEDMPSMAMDVDIDEDMDDSPMSANGAPVSEASKARVAERAREWYWKNREHVLQKKREKYLQERERILLARRESYQSNRDDILAKRHKYYAENRDRLVERRRMYYEKHRTEILKDRREDSKFIKFVESAAPEYLEVLSHNEALRSDRAVSNLELCERVVNILRDGKGDDVVAFDVRSHATRIAQLTEFLVLVTGTSSRHLNALARDITEGLQGASMVVQGKAGPVERAIDVVVEGNVEDGWICMDVGQGQVMLHVMVPEIRQRYDLDRKWALM
jgi:ribosome-associated protein